MMHATCTRKQGFQAACAVTEATPGGRRQGREQRQGQGAAIVRGEE